jgi:hypothetical protein
LLSVDVGLSWAFTAGVDALRLPGRAVTANQSPSYWGGIVGIKWGYRFGANQECYTPW